MGAQRSRRRSGGKLAALWLLLGLVVLGLPASALAAEPAPFGHACKAQAGVRVCPTEALTERVPSWDGVPLDADVTLPATGEGPWPTIAMLHGWGTNKYEYENNRYASIFAKLGYAVLTYSARGWARSCGTEASRKETPACANGYTHMDDTRYEARDAQYLLGLLADQGITQPKAIGVMGASYGGGASIELAYLKNRIRLPNGSFKRWKSPGGKPMVIKAAVPIAGFSDLVDALQPNGHFLDTEVVPYGQSYEPPGVQMQSIDNALNGEGPLLGAYYAPEGSNPEADLYRWNKLANAGEPWTAEDNEVEHQIYDYHQAYGMPLSGKPAPLLFLQGFTDAIFPVEQALRAYNQIKSINGWTALMFGDVGHPLASNKQNTLLAFALETESFFNAKLKHEYKGPKKDSVLVYTQTCPTSAPGGGPFTAKEWSQIASHTLTFGSSAPQTFTSAGASATLAAEFDPINEIIKEGGNGNDCKETKSEMEPNSATYTMTSPGFTMIGLPTVTADVKATGEYGQIDSRLWDVLPSGEERMISNGVYRLEDNQTGQIKFQLHGNAYEFAKGDTVKLELLGRDAPHYRADNGSFSVELSNVAVEVPAS
jgi:predicted acyl esterase